MSWYEEKISINRGTLYAVWGLILFIVAGFTLFIVSLFSLFGESPYPEPITTLLLVVSIQQFVLITGLMFAMQYN